MPKAVLQAILDGCSSLDWSGAYAPMSAMLMFYDISEGKVVSTQDVAVQPTRHWTAVPDMSGAWVMTRDSPVQLNDDEILSPQSSVSLCLQPSAIAPMKCVDNNDVGTWEISPTAIDDNCVVLTFNQFYTEPGEHDCEEFSCQGECARDALTAAQPRMCRRACVPGLCECAFCSSLAHVAYVTQISTSTHTCMRIRARAGAFSSRAWTCTQQTSPSTLTNAWTRQRRRRHH